ncbi:MAG: hypothetical protein R2685_09725 [Candidatus Nitrosocosmicus sp.]|nr:hypothetical protein [Candidatus Nitrosocosmicus sp.]
MASIYNKISSIRILLSIAILISLIMACFVNQFPVISYEVTNQNNEGLFSSLSRNFDKTLESISPGDNSETSPGDKDDKKISDKEKDGSDARESESTIQNNNVLGNSNVTQTDVRENDLIEKPTLVNSTESIEI